jgi:ABC-2 type transport system permease protein
MPIHDQGYRHYTGERILHGRAWWVIARAAVTERLRERRFLALLLFGWSLFAVRAVQLYLGTTVLRSPLLAVSESTFHEFLNQQRAFVFFITIYAGAGLIANDKQANALQIYLSKPITRADYITGKMMSLALLLISVTWVPAVLLVLLQVLFSGSFDFVAAHPALVPAITVASFLQVLVATLLILALSSLSRSRRFVAILYAALVLFAATFDRAVYSATGSPLSVLISPQNTLAIVTDWIFGTPQDDTTVPVYVAVAALAVILGLCVWILERRVRAVEAVG